MSAVDIPAFNVEETIISQYANSPTLVQLIENLNGYFDQSTNFEVFYDFVWNVLTAQGFGLDIWGRIVGASRYLQVPGGPYFGFQDGVDDFQPFGQAPFRLADAATDTYQLSDTAYRTLILVKAMSNIIATTSPALNALLQYLFAGRGRAYVNDLGNMQMRYTFEFALEPFEYAILTQSGALPHPAGVETFIFTAALPLFGFSEAGTESAAPFGEGIFYT